MNGVFRAGLGPKHAVFPVRERFWAKRSGKAVHSNLLPQAHSRPQHVSTLAADLSTLLP